MPEPLKIFRNPGPNINPPSLLAVLKWKLNWKIYAEKSTWPKKIVIKTSVPPTRVEDHRIAVSFVGHATFLIQTAGLNILTDPVWSQRVSPFTFMGPKRVSAPGVKFNDLPPIDIVLVSHNHYDHMDIATLKRLCKRDKPHIITPLMNDVVIKAHIPHANVTTMDWAEKIVLQNQIAVHLEPAQHWSARGLFDQNHALWGTFIVTTAAGSLCFIGDSGYSSELFKKIGHKHDDIILSLIPIGAFAPRWFMRNVHMNPEEAILVHQDLKSKHSIASHFKTFPLADDGFEQATQELAQAREKYKVSNEAFFAPEIGGIYWFNAAHELHV